MAKLDVRDDIKQGQEPFARIIATVDRLGPSEELELIAPFEPVPLYAVMERRGFTRKSEQTPSGDWRVTFARPSKYPI